jgi:hypothetical protein
MVSIAGLNIISTANFPKVRESDAIRAVSQRVETAIASDAADSSASAAGAGTNAPTGFKATPRLSADVVSALIDSQSENSTESASSTNLAGAPPAQVPAEPKAAPSPDPSAPPTLQRIAGQFDLHNLTNTQFESLAKQLSAAGAISGSALIDIATRLGGLGVSPALEGKPTGPSKIVSIWDGVKDDTPPYDVLSKVNGWLTEDSQAGFPQAQTDQQILSVLNQLSSISNRQTG